MCANIGRWPRKPVLAVAAPHLSKNNKFLFRMYVFSLVKPQKKETNQKKYFLKIAAGHQKIEKMKLLTRKLTT